MTIFIGYNVSEQQEKDIVDLVEYENMYNPSYSGAEMNIQWGDSTGIESNEGDYDFSNVELLEKIQNIEGGVNEY